MYYLSVGLIGARNSKDQVFTCQEAGGHVLKLKSGQLDSSGETSGRN